MASWTKDFRRKEELPLSSSLLFVVTARRTVLELETLSFSMPSVAPSDVNDSATLTKVQGWDEKNKVSLISKIRKYYILNQELCHGLIIIVIIIIIIIISL